MGDRRGQQQQSSRPKWSFSPLASILLSPIFRGGSIYTSRLVSIVTHRGPNKGAIEIDFTKFFWGNCQSHEENQKEMVSMVFKGGKMSG